MNSEKRRKRQESIRKQYDKTAKNLPLVNIGGKIYFPWSRSEIIKKIASRTRIRTANGRTYKRNRVHIRRNMGQKLNKTTYNDHTCIPFFTNDSNHDDLTTANNNTSPMKRTRVNDQHEPAGYQPNSENTLFIDLLYQNLNKRRCLFTLVVGYLQPAGQIWPAWYFNAARPRVVGKNHINFFDQNRAFSLY